LWLFFFVSCAYLPVNKINTSGVVWDGMGGKKRIVWYVLIVSQIKIKFNGMGIYQFCNNSTG
jgi:hypothetical protein